MSRIDDDGQPGPALENTEPQAEGAEPRLLTRSVPAATPRRSDRNAGPQHPVEQGLQAWAKRLKLRRTTARPARAPIPPKNVFQGQAAWWIVRLGAVAAALILITAVVAVLDLRHALWASLPQLDGEVRAAGLHAPVTVTRNAEGVPSITAASLDDLLFAQGYVTASDRLWQMDGLRRHAAGELAEILGPGLVEHDRRQRYLQIRAAADRAVAALPRDQYPQLEAYARGVNAYIDTHRGALPMEFRLLAYKPAPWSPRDCLLVSLAIYQDMSTGFPQKMNREALGAHLPAALLPDLYPVGSWRDLPPAAQGRSITAPHEVEQIPLDRSQSRLQVPAEARPGELLAVSAGITGAGRCDGCRAGSNNWAVSGQHTASGSPLVSNDMHLNLGIPDIWYEASLHAAPTPGTTEGGLDVVGFTLPGVPFVIVGRNAHVAWGLTNLGADVQDLRVEHLRGTGGDTEYLRPDGTWTLAGHRPERIRVRGGRDLALDVLTTTHMLAENAAETGMETPIISPLYPSEHRALSLAWTAYDPATVTSPFLPINAATDGASLVAAFASFGGPTLNLVWADDRNHIGYHALGRIPVRGPAVQHPRPDAPEMPTNALPGTLPRTLPPDEDDQPPAGQPGDGQPGDGPLRGHADGPQASLEPAAHFILSAYRPLRRRRAAAQPSGPAQATGRSRKHRRVARAITTASSAAPEPALPPTPAPLRYTIGSAISPTPVDASDTSQAWSGYIAYADLPSVADPASGLLVTANSRITSDDYPWAIANDWTDPFRTERIMHLLNGRNGLTPTDMLRVETDVHSDVDQAIAQRLAYAIDHASTKALAHNAKRLREAADLLRDWDGDLTATSPAGAIVAAVRTELWPALLVPQILGHDGSGTKAQEAAAVALLYTWGERTTALELMLQNQPARWLPRHYTRWSDFLAAVTESSLVAAHAPADLKEWQYGKRHTVEIAHPLLGDQHLLSTLLGIRGTTGVRPAPGDATTIRWIDSHFGPSERFTADLASPTGMAYANLTTGESGDGISPWYLDQFGPWLQGTTFPLPLSGGEGIHRLRLLPQ